MRGGDSYTAAAEQDELLADYLPCCETVRIPDLPPVIPDCHDPADIPFLQLALVGKAESLVTGDKDLLVLADTFPCPILTAEAFLAGLDTRDFHTYSHRRPIVDTATRIDHEQGAMAQLLP